MSRMSLCHLKLDFPVIWVFKRNKGGWNEHAHISSSDKTKAVHCVTRRQIAVLIVSAAFFALVLGQGGPAAKAGSCLGNC